MHTEQPRNCADNKTAAVILAGGRGLRLSREEPKQFMCLKNRPLILWSVETFASIEIISLIIIVCPEDHIERTKSLIGGLKLKQETLIVKGGLTRQESSYNAVRCGKFQNGDMLLFHDAARPFVKKNDILKVLTEAEINGAAGLYAPLKDTVAPADGGFINGVIDRSGLMRALTPQGFRFELIKSAHEYCIGNPLLPVTDDASMIIHSGGRVKCVTGDESNIKITDSADLKTAEYLAGITE